jgi:hypothetical protein
MIESVLIVSCQLYLYVMLCMKRLATENAMITRVFFFWFFIILKKFLCTQYIAIISYEVHL